MTLRELKSIIKRDPIIKWVEAGINIFEVNDKLIDSFETFSRLDYYDKHNWLKIYNSEYDLDRAAKENYVPCGKLDLESGREICYTIDEDRYIR